MTSRMLHTLAFVSGVLLLMLVGLPASARAQTITTDATVVGQVVDEGKGALPGVTVTATSSALQVPSVTAVTDERGEYRLTPLPIGTYTVEYALSGFQTMRQEGLRLTVGFTARLDITMKVGGIAETITVTGAAPQVDTRATNAATQLTREVLETIPSGGSGYIGILQMVPGARPVLDVGGSTMNTNPGLHTSAEGGSGAISQTWQSVDGVATKNPRNQESGNYFDLSSVEEATVSSLGHDASVPSRGLNMNVVLTSGGNQFRGKALYGFTNSNFEGAAPEESGGGSVDVRDDLRAELGGRIIPDKLWFWGSVRKQRDHQSVADCRKSDGSFCDELNNTFFATGKVTAQVSRSNKFTGFFMRNRGFAEETTSALRPWESRRTQVLEPQVGKIEWQGLKGSNLVMTANYGFWEGHSGTICPDGEHNLKTEGADLSSCVGVATIDSVTGVITGYNDRGGERLLESRYQARLNVGYYKADFLGGNHEFKVGFDYFHAPQNRHNVGRGAAKPYRLTFRNGVADRILFWNYPVDPGVALDYYGTYIADSWTIGRRLTLNAGLRHAYDTGYERAGCREVADAPASAVYPAKCYDRTEVAPYNTLVPRVRAAYDVFGDGKTVVKGGWGRYTQMRYADQILMVSKNAIESVNFRWRDLNGNRDYDPGEVNLDLNGSDFISRTAGGSAVTLLQGGTVNPDEKAPYTDEYSLTFERQVTEQIAIRVTGVERHTGNSNRVVNELRPYAAYNIPITNPDPGPDGRVGTSDDPGTSITYYDYPASLQGSAFQRVKVINDGAADEKFHTLELAISKRLANNWQFMASHSATKVDIPFMANAGTYNTVDPNSEINSSNHTWEWMTRASGSYLFPHGIQFAANFEHRSGTALARTALFANGARVGSLTLRVEPIGSIRLPNINLMILRAEKTFGSGAGRRIAVRTNIYNALNVHPATAMTVQSGANFGLVTNRLLPRIMDFQVEYRF